MSEHGLLTFLLFLSQNDELREEIKKLPKGKVLNIAEKMGYKITEEELEFIQQEIIEGEDLPLEVLDKVVGGANLDYLIDWVKKKYFDF